MRTRKWLTLVSMMLALAATGAAAAQVKAGEPKQSAAQVAPEKAQAQAVPKKEQAAAETEAQATEPAAEEKARAEPEPAAEDAAAKTPVGEPAGEEAPPAAGAVEPAAKGEPRFFQEQENPYRFLQRIGGQPRYFPEQRTEARPEGPPLRIEPEPARVRGDAGAAIAIGLALEQDWNLDQGYDLFGEDEVAPRIALWFAHDLLALGERTILAGEIGVGSGRDTTSGEFDGMETTLRNTRLQVAAYLRHLIWPVFQPHLRLAGHVAFVEAELDFGDEKYADDGVSGGGSLGAGFTVGTPTRLFENHQGEFASLSIGVLLEGGYLLASPVSFDLVADEPADRIEVRTASLGELALSGPYFRSSFLVRF